MSFGESCMKIREERGISRKDFAEQLGIPYTTLRNYETGQREPGHKILIKMATILCVSVDDLIGYQAQNKKSPPEPGEESAREEQLRLERSRTQTQESQLPPETALFNAMIAKSNKEDPEIMSQKGACITLLSQVFHKARFGDQYDKDTLNCAADFLSICSRGLDQSQKEAWSFFSHARCLLLQTVKLIGAMVECEQKEPRFARGVLNDFQLLVSWSLYAFSVEKYEEFAEAWDICQETFDQYAIGPEAFEREKEARAEAETYYRQRLSEKKQESQASSANESGAG